MVETKSKRESSLLLAAVRSQPALKGQLKKLANAIGYDTADWVRIVMYQKCFEFIRSLEPSKLDVLEISGGDQWHPHFEFASYEATDYPEFDVCHEALDRKFDVIIADQIFEHLEWPIQAAQNVYKMLKPGGFFIVSTPFLIRVHEVPIDCSRWTKLGMKRMLQQAGFAEELIQTDAWGNRACAKANFDKWAKRGLFGSLKNEPNFPVMVWAFAQKPAE